MSLHHKVCHALGGLFDLPHATTHAIVLPHVAAFNLPAAPEAQDAVARALHPPVRHLSAPHVSAPHLSAQDTDTPDPAHALAALARDLGVPPSLADLGLKPGDLDAAADAVLGKPYANPRPVSRDDLLGILGRALRGDPPA